MEPTNTSFVLHAVNKTSFDERPVPEPHAHEVLVRVKRTGICGSDVHYLTHGKIGKYTLAEPMCLGHESSGVVVKTGAMVPAQVLGLRVAIEPYSPCRMCDYCKGGYYHLCPSHEFAATPPGTCGTLCRFYALTFDMCHPLPDNMTFEEGAMIEPLAVGVHAVVTLGKCTSYDSVIVFGAGPVGLLCMAVAKAVGARRVVAVDINASRLEFAGKYAASDVFLPPSRQKGEEQTAYAMRASSLLKEKLALPEAGQGALTLAIEASGAPSCIQMATYSLAPRGTVVQVGMGSNMDIVMPLSSVGEKELVVKGSFRYGAGDYPKAISLVERGLVNLRPLQSHRFAFKDSELAFQATAKGVDPSGKPVIKCIIDGPLEDLPHQST